MGHGLPLARAASNRMLSVELCVCFYEGSTVSSLASTCSRQQYWESELTRFLYIPKENSIRFQVSSRSSTEFNIKVLASSCKVLSSQHYHTRLPGVRLRSSTTTQ